LKPIQLTGNARTGTGKGSARTLRRSGRIPAVIYGPDRQAASITVSTKDLEMAMKHSSSAQPLFHLVVDGESHPVMIREMQKDPVSGNLLHADFYEFDASKKMRVSVPLVTIGTAKGVEEGGLLQIIRREVEVLCRPTDIPDAIEVDVSGLDIGDSVHVLEVPVKGDVEIPTDVNYTLVTVTAPKMEAVEEEAEGEEEEALEPGEAEEGEDTGAETEA
jgi:large subunit ribosomal protein L25